MAGDRVKWGGEVCWKVQGLAASWIQTVNAPLVRFCHIRPSARFRHEFIAFVEIPWTLDSPRAVVPGGHAPDLSALAIPLLFHNILHENHMPTVLRLGEKRIRVQGLVCFPGFLVHILMPQDVFALEILPVIRHPVIKVIFRPIQIPHPGGKLVISLLAGGFHLDGGSAFEPTRKFFGSRRVLANCRLGQCANHLKLQREWPRLARQVPPCVHRALQVGLGIALDPVMLQADGAVPAESGELC